MSTIKNVPLILDAIKKHYKFGTNVDLANFLGIKPQTLSSWYTRNSIDYDLVYSKCIGIDANWLFTGKGEMFSSKQKEMIVSDNSSSYIRQSIHDHTFASQEIPLYDINAAAGLKMLFQNDHQNIIDTIKIPNLTKCDGAIFINGDSMYPLMKSGDIVLFKEVYNIDYLHYGDIYLLSYEINGDYYLVIKYIQRSDIKDHVKLVSYNKYHEPIDIPLSAITAIALVKANIRYNTMQ